MDRENVSNSLIMIQPSLTQYDLENENPNAAICDIESMKDDVILLMDSYFHIVIWRGSSITDWIKQGYHEQEDYANLKNIMTAPQEDVKVSRAPDPDSDTGPHADPEDRGMRPGTRRRAHYKVKAEPVELNGQ
jgi:hypothetical protein